MSEEDVQLTPKKAVDLVAEKFFPDDDMTYDERLFNLLVLVADVYLQSLEALLPPDRAESPFMGGVMPIDALIVGLHENLLTKQETGDRTE